MHGLWCCCIALFWLLSAGSYAQPEQAASQLKLLSKSYAATITRGQLPRAVQQATAGLKLVQLRFPQRRRQQAKWQQRIAAALQRLQLWEQAAQNYSLASQAFTPDSPRHWRNRIDLARVYLRAGKAALARQEFRQSLQGLQKLYQQTQSTDYAALRNNLQVQQQQVHLRLLLREEIAVLNELGRAHLILGDQDLALHYYTLAAQRQDRYFFRTPDTINHLSRAYLLAQRGLHSEALTIYTMLLGTGYRGKLPPTLRAYCYQRKALMLFELDRFQQARTAAVHARALWRKLGRAKQFRDDRYNAILGPVYAGMGLSHFSLRYFNSLVQSNYASLDYSARAVAHRYYQISQAHRRLGQTRLAVFYGKYAIALLQQDSQVMQNLGGDFYAVDNVIADKYRYLIDLLLSAGRTEEALNIYLLLQQKQRSLRSWLSADSAHSGRRTLHLYWNKQEQPLAHRLLQVHQQIQQRHATVLKQVQAHFATAQATNQTTAASFTRDVRLQQRTSELQRMHDTIDVTLPQGSEPEAAKPGVAYRLNASRIGQDEALLIVLLHEQTIHALLITRDVTVVRSSTVKRQEFLDAIDQFRIFMTQRQKTPLRRLRKLYDFALRPLEADLQRLAPKRLLINADGLLQYLPFAALNDGDKFMVELYQIVNVSLPRQTPVAAAKPQVLNLPLQLTPGSSAQLRWQVKHVTVDGDQFALATYSDFSMQASTGGELTAAQDWLRANRNVQLVHSLWRTPVRTRLVWLSRYWQLRYGKQLAPAQAYRQTQLSFIQGVRAVPQVLPPEVRQSFKHKKPAKALGSLTKSLTKSRARQMQHPYFWATFIQIEP